MAGPYGDNNPKWKIAENVQRADAAGRTIAKKGHTPFIPHKQTWHWEDDKELKKDDFLRIDLEWLSLCHAILLLPNWETSEGAKREKTEAEKLGLLVFYSADELPS